MDISFGISAYVPSYTPIRAETALLKNPEKQKNLVGMTDRAR